MRTHIFILAVVADLVGVFGCGGVAAEPPGDAGKKAGQTSADSGKDAGQTTADSGKDAGQSGRACSDDTNCGPNQICGYALSAACAAQGECVAAAPPQTGPHTGCILAYACGCDGGTIVDNETCGFGVSGYVAMPIRYLGACDGG